MAQSVARSEAKFGSWTDREIFGLDQDRLKFDHYAGVLAEIIREADTPLTLGVFGPWGSGKTSLLRLIKDTLDTQSAAKFKTVWFNAWTFDKEDALWRALILLVLKALRAELKDHKKLDDLEASLYRDVDREDLGGVTVDWGKVGVAAAGRFARLSLSLVPGVGSLLADAVDKATEKVTGEKIDTLFDAVQREKRKLHREHIESLEQFQLGFAELLRDHFVTQDRRLVVFIDDLDRCLPEKAIGVLEAIKLFLDAPGCVYLIGADRDVIEQGIRVKYKDFFVGEAASPPISGDQYLEKIIQIPFNMPPLQEERIGALIAQYDQTVPDDCRRILAVGIEPNPRKVKRTVNVFRLLNKLAERRVIEKELDRFTPGLLAKIVVVQNRWRRLYADLLDYPNLIQDLERHFRAEEQGEREKRRAGEAETRVEGAAQVAPKTERQTLLERHARKEMGNMLRLPPYFEALKIDEIQLYLYLTHTVETKAAAEEAEIDVDARRWDDLLSNDRTRIRAAAEAVERDGQGRGYARRLIRSHADDKALSLHQRASALTAAGYLGDPRFQPDTFYLPDEPRLGFVEVPAGPFSMGSDPKQDAQADEDEQPQHEATLPAYYIARYPVTVAQFGEFVRLSGYKPSDTDSLEGPPNHPVVYVSWRDATTYCKWLSEMLKQSSNIPDALAKLMRERNAHVTLPSEAEWEKAARGSHPSPLQGEGAGVRVYPWGDEFDPQRANTSESGLGATSAVGCFANGASPYGVLDLSGNVWEWTRSLWGKKGDKPDFKYPYDPNDGRREDLKAPNDVRRVLRGGSWLIEASRARCACRRRYTPDFRGSTSPAFAASSVLHSLIFWFLFF